jgi:hypothetical protein
MIGVHLGPVLWMGPAQREVMPSKKSIDESRGGAETIRAHFIDWE